MIVQRFGPCLASVKIAVVGVPRASRHRHAILTKESAEASRTIGRGCQVGLRPPGSFDEPQCNSAKRRRYVNSFSASPARPHKKMFEPSTSITNTPSNSPKAPTLSFGATGRHTDIAAAGIILPRQESRSRPQAGSRQVNEFCGRAVRTVNQKLDPC